MKRTLAVYLSLGAIFIGCGGKKDEASSKIAFRAPNLKSLGVPSTSQSHSLATIPSNRKACWGVSVAGAGIVKHEANACKPETGQVAGFVESGALVEISVPKGLNRKIDIYLYLQQVGENLPCPQMGSTIAPRLDSVFLVGTKSDISLVKDVEDIAIDINFPGTTQSLATVIQAPASCLPASGNLNFRVSSGYGISTGAGLKLYGRMGRDINSPKLTGPGIQLEVKK